jgi:hypothetical protein
MSSFSLAIFDYDGTLADSFPWFCSVLNQTARQFGFREVAEDEIDELRALGTREIIARLGVAKWKLPAIAMHMRKLSADSGDAVALFPGVEPMLASRRILPTLVFGSSVPELDEFRPLVAGQVVLAEGAQRLLGDGRVLLDHEQLHRLAGMLVRHADGGDLQHAGMPAITSSSSFG